MHGIWRLPNAATNLSEMHAALPPRRNRDYEVVADSRTSALITEVASEASSVSEDLDLIYDEVRKSMLAALNGQGQG